MLISEGLQGGSFREGATDHATTLIIAAMEGIMNQWLADRTAFSLERIRTKIRRMILGYVAARY